MRSIRGRRHPYRVIADSRSMLSLARSGKIGLIKSLFKMKWDNSQICYLLFAICHHPVGVP
jgi:hypothetical protein